MSIDDDGLAGFLKFLSQRRWPPWGSVSSIMQISCNAWRRESTPGKRGGVQKHSSQIAC